MTPTVADARARAVVRLSDGRTARLIAIPKPRSSCRGVKARVQLPSGCFLSVETEHLEVVE